MRTTQAMQAAYAEAALRGSACVPTPMRGPDMTPTQADRGERIVTAKHRSLLRFFLPSFWSRMVQKILPAQRPDTH